MQSILKISTSQILANQYEYPRDRVQILKILDQEQNNFCAYTEEYCSPGFSRDVEHFDPTLKNTVRDSYYNWFSASSRINRKKGSKKRWSKYQPILHPTASDLPIRLIYSDGYYIKANPTDIQAENLSRYLLLNDLGLPKERKDYIDCLKHLLRGFNNSIESLKAFLLKYPNIVKYKTAIQTEFGIVL